MVTHTILESGCYDFSYGYTAQANAEGNSIFTAALTIGGVTVDFDGDNSFGANTATLQEPYTVARITVTKTS